MNRIIRSLTFSAAVAATLLAPMLEASAGERWRQQRPKHPGHHHRQDARDDMLAAGIVGLALGALAVGVVSASRESRSYPAYRGNDFPPRPGGYRAGPKVVYADDTSIGGVEPWSREWFAYCEDRYRSFNARTGTFRGFDGQDHFCVAN